LHIVKVVNSNFPHMNIIGYWVIFYPRVNRVSREANSAAHTLAEKLTTHVLDSD
jgi:hypothetical protein